MWALDWRQRMEEVHSWWVDILRKGIGQARTPTRVERNPFPGKFCLRMDEAGRQADRGVFKVFNTVTAVTKFYCQEDTKITPMSPPIECRVSAAP